MSCIILDLGSGTICQNDKTIVKRMIDEIREVDTDKHAVILKWQLFTKIPDGSPADLPILKKEIFEYAYEYAKKNGYQTTSSFFDDESLEYLLQFEIPFVKIACKDWLYDYIQMIPRNMSLVISVPSTQQLKDIDSEIFTRDRDYLFCIPEYPASIDDYERKLGYNMSTGLSDHTKGFYLFNKYKPRVYEKHFMLEDSTGYDTGEWAVTSEMLKEIL